MLLKLKRQKRGFTLVEVMFASGVLAVVFSATITILQYHNVQTRKAMEQSMMLDFARHYLELARNQPFYLILPSQPINTLYDGDHGAPNIRFPASADWHDLWTTDFRNFHPDLEWFESQSPQYRCVITNQVVESEVRAKYLNFFLRWQPPLAKGPGWRTIQLEVVVYPDFK